MQSPSAHILISTLLLAFSSTVKANPVPFAAAVAIAAPWPSATQTYDQTSDYGGNTGLNVAGGASAGDNGGSFNLSTGAIIAISVVVALVVILGVASTVLFYLAKKRQWEVRKSISRASRRVTAKITGKPLPPSREEAARYARRHGAVRMTEKNAANVKGGAIEKERAAKKPGGAKAFELSTPPAKKMAPVMPPAA